MQIVEQKTVNYITIDGVTTEKISSVSLSLYGITNEFQTEIVDFLKEHDYSCSIGFKDAQDGIQNGNFFGTDDSDIIELVKEQYKL